MTVGLGHQSESGLCPLRRIDGLSSTKILKSFLIFTDTAVNVPARPECDRLRIKLNDHIEVSNSALRGTKLHPGHMTTEISMRVSRILFDPFVDNLKIVPRIGSQKIVEHFHLFCGRRFFHYFPSPRHHRA